MRIKRTLAMAGAATLASLALAACGNSVDDDVAPNPAEVDMPAVDYERDDVVLAEEGEEDPSSCNRDRADPYIGRIADYEVRAELLEKVAPIVNVRWLSPGDQASEDREMQRLTIELDDDETILAVRCG
jgi:hypothetical protein